MPRRRLDSRGEAYSDQLIRKCSKDRLSSHRLSECGFSTATGEARCAVTRSTQRASQGNAATITAQITSQLYWLHRSVSDAIISAQVSAMRHDYDIFEKFP